MMVRAMLSVKRHAAGETIYKFSYVPHLHFCVTSRGLHIHTEGKYEGLQSTPLHKQHLFARDKESIVRAFTYFRDERKAGRVVVKGRTITIVANMFGYAPSTVQKVLDEALSEVELRNPIGSLARDFHIGFDPDYEFN